MTLLLLLGNHAAQADIPAGYSVLETITYEYDAEGNRIAKGATVSGTPETPIEAQYDAGNRLTQLTLKGQGPNGADLACTLGYDASGNLTTKTCGTDTTQYTWDARNRLIGIQSPGFTASFRYDALGRRIERTVNGDTLQYLYDGDQAIAELRNGAVNAHLLTGLAIDEAIARYTHEGERILLTDALGSVLIASKEDTSVATAYGYSPFGETQLMGMDEHNPIQYTARENDDTGLYYYRARYYDPQLKRFVSEDPSRLQGGINLYSYVEGNPANKIDSDGLMGRAPGTGKPAYSNGNWKPGYTPQDMVCTPPGNKVDINKCTKKCCIEHDLCYEKYRCNASSWSGIFTSLYGSYPCQKCNERAAECFTKAIIDPNCKDEDTCK